MPRLDLLDAEILPKQILRVIDSAPVPGLQEGPSCDATAQKIEQIDAQHKGTLIESGLWLLCGELDLSHSISQNDGSAEGSFWHGIMHRREGDFGNSKYWFGRVGHHSVHSDLAARISDSEFRDDFSSFGLDDESTVAYGLVDACQAAARHTNLVPALEQICWWEWQLLFRHCM